MPGINLYYHVLLRVFLYFVVDCVIPCVTKLPKVPQPLHAASICCGDSSWSAPQDPTPGLMTENFVTETSMLAGLRPAHEELPAPQGSIYGTPIGPLGLA